MSIFCPIRFVASGRARFGVMILALLWFGALAVRATDYYVRPSATCTNTDLQSPYTSWDTAATNIQWAVNVAMSNIPATVWVSNGTYCLTNQIEITNNITVQSTNGYSNTLVYAGYPAWTTRCFYVTCTGIVDGFTISNGHYMISNVYIGGGGMFISNGTVQNSYFVNNVCSNAGGWTGGGGVFVTGSGVVFNCTFVENRQFWNSLGGWPAPQGYDVGGGGIMIYKANAQIMNCSIMSNYVSGAGGGILLLPYQDTCTYTSIISHCVISGNTSAWEGAACYTRNKAEVIDCIISNNRGLRGIFQGWKVKMRNCTVIDNINAGEAAAVLISSPYNFSDGIVSNCVISGNRSTGGLTIQGGIADRCVIKNNLNNVNRVYVGYSTFNEYAPGAGGVTITDFGGILRNSTICNNSNTYVGGSGGGLYVSNAAASKYMSGVVTSGVINCTIANNYSTNGGGGIYAQATTNYIVNCVIAGNTAPSNSDIYCYDSINTNKFYYSCVNTNLAPNQGNITNNPRFMDSSAGNWRLANNSPCMNTGTNMSWMMNYFDLDGNARIRYGIVDMGAYEKINEATVYNFR